MNTLDAIYARRSIRAYQDKPVDHETVPLLLKAAMAAPSAVNALPWEFVVTDDDAQLAKIKEACVYARYNAPLAIIVCGNMQHALSGDGQDYWVQDCSAAIENILLAATDLGLGSVWIGVYPIESRVKALQRAFDLPEHIIPLSVVYVGHPAEEKDPRTQFDEQRVHWHRYGHQG